MELLAGFTATPVELPDFTFDGHAPARAIKAAGAVIEGPEILNTVFLLSCACGHEEHHVMGYHWRNPDFGNQLVFLSPIVLRCASCGTETELIDTDQHGYVAEVGGIVATARGEGERGEYRCDQCGPQAFRVYARFEYPAGLFHSKFKKFRGREQDFFSWFTAVGKCPGCSRLLSITDFECA
jgi:hypothetical protein